MRGITLQNILKYKMAKESKEMCCKLDKKMLMIVATAIVFIAVVALVIMQKPVAVEPQPKPVESVCGDGVCASGESCPADCQKLSGTACSKAEDCRVNYGPCGSVNECVNINEPAPVREFVTCTQSLLEDTVAWHNTYCECSDGNCVSNVNWAAACSEFCRAMEGGGPTAGSAFWFEHCTDYECPTHDFEGNKSLEEQYNDLAESCIELGYGPEFETCMQQPVAVQYKGWCESQGGYFGQIGLNPTPYCNLPTSDGGKDCTDSSQCESTCLADMGLESSDNLPISGVTGKCADYSIVVGCIAMVEEGTVNGILCID